MVKFDDWCGHHRLIGNESKQNELLKAVSPFRSREQRLMHAARIYEKQAREAVEAYESIYSGGPDDADIAFRIGYGYYRRFRVDGKPEDGANAIKWLTEANLFDHPEAPMILGNMHANGFAVDLDLTKANELLASSAERGHQAAIEKIAAGGFDLRVPKEEGEKEVSSGGKRLQLKKTIEIGERIIRAGQDDPSQ